MAMSIIIMYTTTPRVSTMYKADSRFAPSQWETLLQSNAVSHWLCANLDSALLTHLLSPTDLLFVQEMGLHDEAQRKTRDNKISYVGINTDYINGTQGH